MTQPVWNGRGDMPLNVTYFETEDGTIRGRPYVRARAAQALARYRRLFSLETRNAVLRATIENDAWMQLRNHCLVASVCRDVSNYLFANGAIIGEGE